MIFPLRYVMEARTDECVAEIYVSPLLWMKHLLPFSTLNYCSTAVVEMVLSGG